MGWRDDEGTHPIIDTNGRATEVRCVDARVSAERGGKEVGQRTRAE